MVDLNSTMMPLIDQVGNFFNVVKVLFGGVFGIYLATLYFRWKEYREVRAIKKIAKEIMKDLRSLAQSEGVHLEPIKVTHLQRIEGVLKKLMTEKIQSTKLAKIAKKDIKKIKEKKLFKKKKKTSSLKKK